MLLLISIFLFHSFFLSEYVIFANEREATSENRNIIATGTIGSDGALWTLDDDGVVEIGGGVIWHDGFGSGVVWPEGIGRRPTWLKENRSGYHVARTSPWHDYRELVRIIRFTEPVIAGESLRGLFGSLPRLMSIENASYIDTSGVVDMNYMFFVLNHGSHPDASSLIYVDVSAWDTSRVRYMRRMFENAGRLAEIDASSWDTSSVTNMGSMFYGARSIKSLDVSNWDTSNVTNMAAMFGVTSELEYLDVSGWDTSNVEFMGSMFSHARSLTSLDVSNWDTSQVTRMAGMFSGARNLTSLDVSNWDTSNVQDMLSIFGNAQNIRTLMLGEGFEFHSNANLPEITPNAKYTGYWQNVGEGTIYEPAGLYILTSAELVEQFDGVTMADVFVRQRRHTPLNRYYMVQWGDTLSELAVQFGTTVTELARLNNIENPDFILAGQILTLPRDD